MDTATQISSSQIPSSDQVVKVSIIDTTLSMHAADPDSYLMIMQPKIPGFDIGRFSAFALLIEHSSGRKLLYDLGLRKDWQSMHPLWVGLISQFKFTVEKDVPEILAEQGVGLDNIDIIWSHWHFEHIGDPSKFPSSSKVMVGPGFKKAFMPGYPTNPDSMVNEDAFTGREVKELDFSGSDSLKIGGFDALDYFGDGSFYVLDTPGHAVGHLGGLARTTTGPDTFILMVGDCAHHAAELRPSQYVPLPQTISPDPLNPISGHSCLGEIFLAIHPNKSRTEPFFHTPDPPTNPIAMHDLPAYNRTLDHIQENDGRADNNVFVVLAHDESLRGVVDFYPSSANDWKKRGWGEKARWAFLSDFSKAINV